MPIPAEIAEDLRVMTVELEKLGAFDQHASTLLRLTRNTLRLADQVVRLEAEAAGKDVALRLVVDSLLSAGRNPGPYEPRGGEWDTGNAPSAGKPR